jgi:hypothetical protein
MEVKHFVITLLIGATFVLNACAGSIEAPVAAAPAQAEAESGSPVELQAEKRAPLQFVNHIQMGLAEQDVFVETEDGTVRRILAEEAEQYADAPLYATPVLVPHDPFGLDASLMEPFAKGEVLGFSMGEWLQATGSGSYTVYGEKTELELSFENLVPDGVYTLWCATISTPPAYRIVDIACGNPYGLDNTVIADSDGNAEVRLWTTTMPDASETYMPVVAMAYHSDGLTYGEYPGDFGLNSHVQIMAFVPAPADAAWEAIE